MTHHQLDVYPIPREKSPRFINEPWLVDKSLLEYPLSREPAQQSVDNLRIYVPVDLNKKAILRRLSYLVYHYGEANEKNESEFCMDLWITMTIFYL